MRIAAGLAPNLKEARMFRAAAGWSFALMRAIETPRKQWQGFAINKQKQISTPGSLRHLQLARYGSITKQVVERWSRHTDFSVLRTLKLESNIEADALDCLATKCDFSSVRTLVLVLTTRSLLEPPTMDYSSLANHFLCSLPPLFTLKLVDERSQTTLDTIFVYHGAALRGLWLSPSGTVNRLVIVITQREVELIAEHCPLLEDLSLTVPRAKGDAGEVAIYKALGLYPSFSAFSLHSTPQIVPSSWMATKMTTLPMTQPSTTLTSNVSMTPGARITTRATATSVMPSSTAP